MSEVELNEFEEDLRRLQVNWHKMAPGDVKAELTAIITAVQTEIILARVRQQNGRKITSNILRLEKLLGKDIEPK